MNFWVSLPFLFPLLLLPFLPLSSLGFYCFILLRRLSSFSLIHLLVPLFFPPPLPPFPLLRLRLRPMPAMPKGPHAPWLRPPLGWPSLGYGGADMPRTAPKRRPNGFGFSNPTTVVWKTFWCCVPTVKLFGGKDSLRSELWGVRIVVKHDPFFKTITNKIKRFKKSFFKHVF